MNLFDIIGPIMIGPSSSHTSGVVRIGNVVHQILGQTPEHATIKFHGSFAKTYLGHGSHKAIVAGLMGYNTYDPDIKNSLEIAKQIGFEYSIETIELANAHPNTVIIEADAKDKHVKLKAESIGGGNILIKEIDGFAVEITCQKDVLFISFKDTVGMVFEIAELFKANEINIADMKVHRYKKNDNGIILLELDSQIDNDIVEKINRLEYVNNAKIIPSVYED